MFAIVRRWMSGFCRREAMKAEARAQRAKSAIAWANVLQNPARGAEMREVLLVELARADRWRELASKMETVSRDPNGFDVV